MDYEKKYNEALERAQKATRAGSDVAMDIVQYIFPELAESEDERVIRTLYCLVKDHDWINGASKEECLAWLEKQKEQKPAEWSKEDEKMRVNILNALTPHLVYSVGTGTYTGTSTYKYDDEIRWLKSLRPSWKPSEEQMMALDKAIPVCMGVVGRDEIAPLESLYEELKQYQHG